MGMMPNNTGGFGDVVKAAQVFVRNELTPLQEQFKEINHWLGKKSLISTHMRLIDLKYVLFVRQGKESLPSSTN